VSPDVHSRYELRTATAQHSKSVETSSRLQHPCPRPSNKTKRRLRGIEQYLVARRRHDLSRRLRWCGSMRSWPHWGVLLRLARWRRRALFRSVRRFLGGFQIRPIWLVGGEGARERRREEALQDCGRRGAVLEGRYPPRTPPHAEETPAIHHFLSTNESDLKSTLRGTTRLQPTPYPVAFGVGRKTF